MKSKSTDVIIIGAGPAGIACAIQLKRSNVDFIIFEKEGIGGLLKNASLIENYPGFPNGISGEQLINLLNKQSEIFTNNIVPDTVNIVESNGKTFDVRTSKINYLSKYLVIASGTKPIIPVTPAIADNINEKIFYDIYKLGIVNNKSIAIIGAGDCAFDYALNLSENNNVVLLNRTTRIKALPLLQDRVFENKNIEYLENMSVSQVCTSNERVEISFASSDKIIRADYLLIAVGREPNLDFISDELLNHDKIFRIGDVKNGLFRQTTISVGDGTFCAMQLSSMLTQGE